MCSVGDLVDSLKPLDPRLDGLRSLSSHHQWQAPRLDFPKHNSGIWSQTPNFAFSSSRFILLGMHSVKVRRKDNEIERILLLDSILCPQGAKYFIWSITCWLYIIFMERPDHHQYSLSKPLTEFHIHRWTAHSDATLVTQPYSKSTHPLVVLLVLIWSWKIQSIIFSFDFSQVVLTTNWKMTNQDYKSGNNLVYFLK